MLFVVKEVFSFIHMLRKKMPPPCIQRSNNHEMGMETCNCLLAVLWMLGGSFPTGSGKTIHHDIETASMPYECQMWKMIQWTTSHAVCSESLNGFMPHRGIYVGTEKRRGAC